MCELGFDVWLNNSRGTRYSLEHEFFSNKNNGDKSEREEKKKYWEFSFHEHGIFDQPALWSFVI